MKPSSPTTSSSMLTGSAEPHSTSGSPISTSKGLLPRSVRGATPELRRLIRKKQNADSARRCRLKLRMEREREAERTASPALSDRVDQLTRLLTEMQARLVATELSCAALLERALANAPVAGTHFPVSYAPQTQSPIQPTSCVTMPQSRHAQQVEVSASIVTPSMQIPQPDDALSDNECSSPTSPIAINFQGYFDTPAVSFKQSIELFDEDSDSDLGDAFVSNMDPELPIISLR